MFSNLPSHGKMLITALLLVLIPVLGLCPQETRGVRFSWALVCRGADGRAIEVDYDAEVIPLDSGSTFRVLFKPLSRCRPYLYLHDAQGDLRFCFPRGLSSWDAASRVGLRHSIPGEDSWYRLDEHGGTEVFYLIVSRDRLRELEARTLAYQGARRWGVRAARRRVLQAIRTLIKESSPLAATAEKPTVVAGDFRGVEEEEVAGRTVTAGEVYVTTIRLRH